MFRSMLAAFSDSCRTLLKNQLCFAEEPVGLSAALALMGKLNCLIVNNLNLKVKTHHIPF